MILTGYSTKPFNNKQKMRYLTISKMMAALHDQKILCEDMQNKSHKIFKTQSKLKNNSRLIEKKNI